MANVSKAAIREDIAKKLKSAADRISVFGLKTKFGGGCSSGFALIYNSLEDKKQYDSKCNLRKVSDPDAESFLVTGGVFSVSLCL